MYEDRFSKIPKNQINLPERESVKTLLREKLHREIQGIRTSTDEYQELDLLDPQEVRNMITEIKNRLGKDYKK